jgi:hypothetical protein
MWWRHLKRFEKTKLIKFELKTNLKIESFSELSFHYRYFLVPFGIYKQYQYHVQYNAKIGKVSGDIKKAVLGVILVLQTCLVSFVKMLSLKQKLFNVME